MNVKVIAEILGSLSVLKFFPSDENARAAILQLVCAMASNEKQVRWLVNRMTTGLYNEWPGPREMRACFCSKFKPADGINAYSVTYPDGIPSEKPEALLALPPAGQKRIGPVSADPDIARAIATAAELKSIDPPKKKPRPPSIPVNPDFQPFTQADIDAAVQQHREQKAREQLGGGD